MQVLTDYDANLFQSKYVMGTLIFLVMADTSLNFADGSFVRTGKAAAQLHDATAVDVAYALFVFWVSQQHIIDLNMAEERREDKGEGTRIGDYLVGRTIGEGTFNKVKIARHVHSQQQVAIKLIDKSKILSSADRQRLAKQLKILRKVRHPNIIQLLQILEDHRYYYVVTEYASRGQLFDHIVSREKLSEFQAAKFLQQLVGAVEYLQDMGVVHRDLKPQNVLLDYKFNVKLVDFGLSNIFTRGETLTTACGSPCYAAPEMLAGKPYDPLKVDLWSTGVILYAMCFGYLPFDNPDSAQLYRIIREGVYEVPEHASEALIDLLGRILEINPQKRATVEEIRQHPFCTFSPSARVSGIIPGLSIIPFEAHIDVQMQELGLDTSELGAQIANNKHTHLTATYYLLLQHWLRQKNESLVGYYAGKDALINRHKVVERVKEMYERRLNLRLQQLAKSQIRRQARSAEKKRCKTSDKKMKAGIESGSKFQSREIYLSPQKRKKLDFRHSSSKSQHKGNQKKKLTRA